MLMFKKFQIDRLIKKLASLRLAIALLFFIVIAISLGTFIEQNQSLSFYKENYPDTSSSLINWKVITFFDLCNLYTTPWFFCLLAFFGLALLSCTFTTQVPSFKKFRMWTFSRPGGQIKTCNFQTNIDKKLTNVVLYNIYSNNYHTFRQNKKNYSYSGLLGRVGPIIVHFSILTLLLGTSYGSLEAYSSQELVPRGEIFHLHNLVNYGRLSQIPQTLSWRINDFWITYAQGSKTNQFYSDLSLIDSNGIELKRKTIFVNEPLVYKGVTIYQTDWEILGLKLQLNNNKLFQIPLKKSNAEGRSFWIGSITINNNKIIVVVNDLLGTVSVYDEKGNNIGQTKVGSVFQINETNSLKIVDFVNGTGLQIKEDPSLKAVYLSFFFLMLSGYISFLSYGQVWGVEYENKYLIGGKANRAVLSFQENLKKSIYKVL